MDIFEIFLNHFVLKTVQDHILNQSFFCFMFCTLFTLHTSPLLGIWLAKVLPHFVGLLQMEFYLAMQKYFILMESHLLIVGLISWGPLLDLRTTSHGGKM